MNDDEFIKSKEFTDFMWRCKRDDYVKRLEEEMAKYPYETCEQVSQRVEAQIRAKARDITLEEGMCIVRESGILLLLEWDIDSTITLGTIKRQDQEIFSSEDEVATTLSSSGFNPRWETLAIWALAPNTDKPLVVEPTKDLRGGLIIKRVSNTPIVEVATLAMMLLNLAEA